MSSEKDEMPYTMLAPGVWDPDSLSFEIVQNWDWYFVNAREKLQYRRMLYMMLGYKESEIGSDAWGQCDRVVKSFIMMMTLIKTKFLSMQYTGHFGYLHAEVISPHDIKLVMSMKQLPALDDGKPVDDEWNYHRVPALFISFGRVVVFDLYLGLTVPINEFYKALMYYISKELKGCGNILRLKLRRINSKGRAVTVWGLKIPL